jgi:isoleucyl-tRNA synthetase
MELMDKFSADSFRFLMLMSPLTNGENFALADKDVGDVARKLGMVWNMYDFFTMYAAVDGWESGEALKDPMNKLTNPLDRWVVSRLHQLVAEVEERTEAYDLQGALKPILPYLDDASNWYVRRSRRRFWKSEDDGDKADAYTTLHYVLGRLAYLLAPFTPFMAEELHNNLLGGESVHLQLWLPAGEVDEMVIADMARARQVIEQGLAARMVKSDDEAQVKVRQPLSLLSYGGEKLDSYYEAMIADEVNVKEVKSSSQVKTGEVMLDKTITPELKREGLMREIIRVVQGARKQAGLQVDDRIALKVTAAGEVAAAYDEYKTTIWSETLTDGGKLVDKIFTTSAKIDDHEVGVELCKVS